MDKSTLVYLRVSGGPGQDLDSQKKAVSEFVSRKLFQNVVVIEDVISGRKKKRPKFTEMVNKVSAGWVERIVCWKVDRIGRGAKENLELAEACQERSCDLLGVADGLSLLGPNGKFVFTLLSALAEREWDNISTNTKRGMAEARRQGKAIGGSAGGHTQRVVDAVPAMRILAAEGFSAHRIAKRLHLSYKTVRPLHRAGYPDLLTRKQAVAKVPLERRGKKYQQAIAEAKLRDGG